MQFPISSECNEKKLMNKYSLFKVDHIKKMKKKNLKVESHNLRKKLLCILLARQQILLYFKADGSRVNRLRVVF